MAIDLYTETLILPSQSAQLPTKPDPKTLRKWITDGCISKKTGERFFLEFRQVGNLIYTSIEAFDRFQRRLNGEKVDSEPPRRQTSPVA